MSKSNPITIPSLIISQIAMKICFVICWKFVENLLSGIAIGSSTNEKPSISTPQPLIPSFFITQSLFHIEFKHLRYPHLLLPKIVSYTGNIEKIIFCCLKIAKFSKIIFSISVFAYRDKNFHLSSAKKWVLRTTWNFSMFLSIKKFPNII